MRKILLATVVAALGLPLAALPSLAQTAGNPYEKVLRKYRGMSPVFVRKCDRDGDSLYTNVEMQCVAGIYQAMYISK